MDTTTATAVTPDSVIDQKAVMRALTKKIIVNITVGLVVTVGSTLIVNAIDRKFAATTDIDSTEI